MEGLTQYGDSDSDQEQQNSSAPSAGPSGESKRCLLFVRHSHVLLGATLPMLRMQGQAGMAMQMKASLLCDQHLKAWARRPHKPCQVQRLSFHKEE